MMAVEFKIAITAGAVVMALVLLRMVALPDRPADRDAAEESVAEWSAIGLLTAASVIFGSLLTALWRLA